MTFKVITNGQYRPIEYKVPETDDELESDEVKAYVTYRGYEYFLDEFMRVREGGELDKLGWDGYCTETVWSAVVIRFSEDGEGALLGRFIQLE